jgi:hypothetical protein
MIETAREAAAAPAITTRGVLEGRPQRSYQQAWR